MKSFLRELGKATGAVLRQVIPPMVHREDIADAIGYSENAGSPVAVVPGFVGEKLLDTTNGIWYRATGVTAGAWAPMAGGVAPFVDNMAAPQVATNTATLTVAQVLGGLIVATPTSAAAYTLPTGAILDDAVLALKPDAGVGTTFDLTIINIGGTGDDITMTAPASGITLVGDPVVGPVADVATEQMAQGTWRFRRTAADTFVAYRVS